MRARTLAGLALLALAGCHSPVTEVVVVVDTNLSLPPKGSAFSLGAEADAFEIVVSSATMTTDQAFGGGLSSLGTVQYPTLPTFPATIGLVPRDDASDAPFEVKVALFRMSTETSPLTLVVERSATGIHFVRGQTRMLFLSLLRACACKGTNCPDPTSTPGCADLVAPTLTPFDPNAIPHVDRVDAGPAADGGGDAAHDAAAEALTSHDAATDRAVEAVKDASDDARPDVARDLAAEAASDASPADLAPEAPARFALGHTCAGASQCENDTCIDGVCCESKCACGTCGAGGTCSPAAAGTDPRSVCGPYTCDGAGACVTTCPQAYGECNSPCKAGAFCDGAGACQMAMGMSGSFCVIGSCTCVAGLSCHPPDAGGAGVCM